ncbi:MAG TPA: response regulator transcription factor [Actinomycetota bacterium]|nr:response regulator transcription factor [Actinomycetota bacterium]
MAPRDETRERAEDTRLRVMIVDDEEVWRVGLRTVLERDDRCLVVAEAADGAEAIELADDAMPNVVVMDMHMPTMDGAEATRRILERVTYAKVLVVSVSGGEKDVVEAMRAGATGYMVKDEPAEAIADAVWRTHEGVPVLRPALAALLLEAMRRPALTSREVDILRLVAQGFTYPEIAKDEFLALKTVQNHVQNILGKFQMHSKSALIAWAIRNGYSGDSE